METNSVLVIGAGMAGLAAARALAEAGLAVTVLEASPRVGGRIFTVRDGDEVIELGAEFLHGRPPELWALVDEAGLQTYELDGPTLAFEDGRLAQHDEESDAVPILEELESWTKPENHRDLSFAEYLELHPELPEEARASAIGYVEGFNAADFRQISITALGVQQAAEDQVEGDRLFRIRDGYDRLPEFLAGRVRHVGGTIELQAMVERIDWTPGHVRVSGTRGGSPILYEAERAVIALPLGVLQRDAVEFVPVPDAVREARRLRMGQVRRFTVVFHTKFWAQPRPARTNPPGDFSFLFSFGTVPPVWWTPLPAKSCTITGWVGGRRSAELANLTPQQLGELACGALAAIFSVPAETVREQLRACYTHDWQRDGLFYGAYSYVPAGGLDACSKMTAPVESTLFFAGEHTDTTGHWGTVHAALRSGLRAARQMLQS